MKKIICLNLFVFMVNCGVVAQSDPTNYQWRVTLKVVDEDGSPLAGANTGVGFFVNSTSASIDGSSDIYGIFTATHSARTDLNQLGFSVEKEGCYSTRMGYLLEPPYDPLKWNPTITLVLKKIGKPIGMYAKSITDIEFPIFNKPIGYDLMAGDWATPYGKGVNSDILFTENHAEAKSGYTFTVSFPNPADGIQGFSIDESLGKSVLLSSHEAPVDGYQPKYEQTHIADPNRIYYFRARTVLDENGKLKTAFYGKIYGDFMQFRYYLNPSPNDRNVEFDPKHNLLTGLKSFEQVTAP
jgi:hypothetical protein